MNDLKKKKKKKTTTKKSKKNLSRNLSLETYP